MRLIVKGLLRGIAVLALLALLGGCAMVRVAYNNAEPLVRYAAHDNFDLDERQSEQFRNRLARFHDWHRANELPLYAGLLRTAMQRGEKAITRQDVAWAAAELRGRYRVMITKAVEEAAPILATLSEEQTNDLERRIAKANDKYAKEFLSGGEAKQLRVQAKRLVGRFKDWTGTLTERQEDLIERFVKQQLGTTQMRFENRKRWQREALGLLRQHRGAQALAPRLADIFVNPEAHRTPEFRRALVIWEADLTDLVLEVERELSPEQRAHVLNRMQRYAVDFNALANQNSVAAAAGN